jgi:hypothetical protein
MYDTQEWNPTDAATSPHRAREVRMAGQPGPHLLLIEAPFRRLEPPFSVVALAGVR